jgi:hypothetical protein
MRMDLKGLAGMIESQIGEPMDDPDGLRRSAIEALSLLAGMYDAADDHVRHVQHLESRIAAQRRNITALLSDRRVTISRSRGWWEGREALLKEQLRAERAWREDAERKLQRAEAILTPPQ